MVAIALKILAFIMSIIITLFPSLKQKDVDIICSIDVKEQTMMVKLKSNPSTGCTWTLENSDPSVLKLESKTYESSLSNGEMEIVGAGGYDKYCFKSASAGTTTLKFVYGQHWDGGILFGEETLVCKVDSKGNIKVVSDNWKEF